MNELKVNLCYWWEAVSSDTKKEYFFPEQITQFMKNRYKCPTIYRWNIYKNEPEDLKIIYIGESEQLCPRRVKQYLNPDPSQKTNQRINEKLQNYLDRGFKVRLETLSFDEIVIGDFTFTRDDLTDEHVRQFIEELLITYYKRKEFTILNL